MKSILVIINLMLTCVAAVLTSHVAKHSTAATVPTAAATDEGDEADFDLASVTPPERVSRVTQNRSDLMWETNLFHPDRRYIEDIDVAPPDPVTEEEAKEHFELISIAQVAQRSCASIRVIIEDKSRGRRSARTRRSRSSRRKPTPARSAKDNQTQKVYRLNDPVGETGFVLTEIGINYVVIQKNDQEITLTLDKADEGSELRREQYAKSVAEEEKRRESEARKQKAADARERAKEKRNNRKKDAADSKADEKKPAASPAPPPPPPPPPPPATNTPETPSRTDGASRNSTRELRNQYLQRVREGSSSR